MMNWSAKDGARSSPHYGGEGVSIHPSHQRCVQTARYGRTTRDPRRPRTVLGWHRGKPTYKSDGEVEGDVVRGVGRPNST